MAFRQIKSDLELELETGYKVPVLLKKLHQYHQDY
jgi:hypothetical protein